MEIPAYISLGSNIGDREMHLLRAVAEIGKLPASRVTALSPFYETTPVGVTGQRNFYNACLRLSTGLPPEELLERLLGIETTLGRTRQNHWGPRTIDLDLLLYGEAEIHTEQLTIPHPRMTERLFVLRPLCDIAPDAIHPPTGLSIVGLLRELRTDEQVTPL